MCPGLSIISARNLLVDSSSFLNTGCFAWDPAAGGTAPRAGVDIEPNEPKDVLHNVTLRDCTAAGNVDDAFTISANYLRTPLSVTFERCVAKDCAGGWGSGFSVKNALTQAAGSSIALLDCAVSNMSGGALTLQGQAQPWPGSHTLVAVALRVAGLAVHSAPRMWVRMSCTFLACWFVLCRARCCARCCACFITSPGPAPYEYKYAAAHAPRTCAPARLCRTSATAATAAAPRWDSTRSPSLCKGSRSTMPWSCRACAYTMVAG